VSGFDTEEIRAEFEKRGVITVRMLLEGHRYNHLVGLEAIKWLAEKDREIHLRAESVKAEEIDIARSARDAAWAANDLAAAANVTADAAAASARLSAEAAKTNNIIATIALIAAVIAMAISIIGVFVK